MGTNTYECRRCFERNPFEGFPLKEKIVVTCKHCGNTNDIRVEPAGDRLGGYYILPEDAEGAE